MTGDDDTTIEEQLGWLRRHIEQEAPQEVDEQAEERFLQAVERELRGREKPLDDPA